MEIEQTNGPATANRTRASLGAFCTWAIRAGLIETSPVAFTNKAVENGPRDRTMTDAELVMIWQALDELGDDPYSAAVKLLILFGLRRGEVGGLLWSEIDFEAGLITVSARRTKNGKPHLVPMSAPVRALLEAQPRRVDRDRVFADVTWAYSKTKLDRRIAEIAGAPLAPWVIHDLRRTFSTKLHDELGVLPHVVETLLGHTGHQGGVAGVYNKALYLPECSRALDRWADHVLALVTGEPATAEVIQLRA